LFHVIVVKVCLLLFCSCVVALADGAVIAVPVIVILFIVLNFGRCFGS